MKTKSIGKFGNGKRFRSLPTVYGNYRVCSVFYLLRTTIMPRLKTCVESSWMSHTVRVVGKKMFREVRSRTNQKHENRFKIFIWLGFSLGFSQTNSKWSELRSWPNCSNMVFCSCLESDLHPQGNPQHKPQPKKSKILATIKGEERKQEQR